jgi:hypothetical protein
MVKTSKPNKGTASSDKGGADSTPNSSVPSGSASATASDGNGSLGSEKQSKPTFDIRNRTESKAGAVDPKSAASGDSSSRSGGTNSGSSRKSGERRNSGSSSSSSSKREKEGSTKNLELLFLSIHAGIAAAFDADEFSLDADEARELAANMQRVSNLYSNKVLSPAQQAWSGLLFTMGCVYIPRTLAFLNRRKEEAAKADINVPPAAATAAVRLT